MSGFHPLSIGPFRISMYTTIVALLLGIVVALPREAH